jgi:hypothetical protein
VGSTPVTIIPDGSGDVAYRLIMLFVVENSGADAADLAQLTPGDATDVAIGAGVWRFTVSAAGAFTIVRTAGSGTARVAVLALWL